MPKASSAAGIRKNAVLHLDAAERRASPAARPGVGILCAGMPARGTRNPFRPLQGLTLTLWRA